MNNYVTGKIIKDLREKRKLTQAQLAELICVSDKTISKWETGKGLPDISLIEGLAKELGVSLIELMNGEYITNQNKSGNMLKSNFYVCPICGNVEYSLGESIVSCCGITLPKLEAEEEDGIHDINVEEIDGKYYISMNHEMTKKHYISFVAFVKVDRVEIVKLYPEQNVEVNFEPSRGIIYAYCNKDGLFKKVIK